MCQSYLRPHGVNHRMCHGAMHNSSFFDIHVNVYRFKKTKAERQGLSAPLSSETFNSGTPQILRCNRISVLTNPCLLRTGFDFEHVVQPCRDIFTGLGDTGSCEAFRERTGCNGGIDAVPDVQAQLEKDQN